MTDSSKNVIKICKTAKRNSGYIASLSFENRNRMLEIIAKTLRENYEAVLKANELDINLCKEKPASFLDRLRLNKARVFSMAEALEKLVLLPDPLNRTLLNWQTEKGLSVSKISVPLGVIAMIFEARPNATIDAVSLCIKSGNAVVLRGSRDAENSCKALVDLVKASLVENGFIADFIQLVSDGTHEGAEVLMKCNEFVDVLIPRGSANLIKAVVNNSTVPVIETGSGNCHCYVEKTADLKMAQEIILNGKLSRPSVCNALESLVIDRCISKEFLPQITKALQKNGVEVCGCQRAVEICPSIKKADESDFYAEYCDLKISVKIVDSLDEAIEHINKHSTSHSETIITKNEQVAQEFLNKIDSAVVYVNASTRFTDGFEFGFGAEMGISTQKLHARGPMGLNELTTYKYCITGKGQLRN